MTLLTRSALPSDDWGCGKVPQGRVLSYSSCDMDTLGSAFDDRLAAITQVGDNSELFPFFKPAMCQFDQIQTRLELFLVGQTLGFDFGLGGPPQTHCVRQTKHSVTYAGKADGHSDDDEAQTIPLLARMFGRRAVVLPSGSANFPAAVFVQSVIKHNDDLTGATEQRLHYKPEEIVGHPVGVPPSLCQESEDTGKVSGFVKPHRKNDLANGVFAHGQHPAYQQHHEDPETRSAETVPEMYLVNTERIWYVTLDHGVPPSQQFRKTGYGWNAFLFQLLSDKHGVSLYKNGETIGTSCSVTKDGESARQGASPGSTETNFYTESSVENLFVKTKAGTFRPA